MYLSSIEYLVSRVSRVWVSDVTWHWGTLFLPLAHTTVQVSPT